MQSSARTLAKSAFLLWLISSAGTAANAPATSSAGDPSHMDPDLARGYALLYELVSTLRYANKVFLVKFESDDVQALTNDVSGTLSDVTHRLEDMAAGKPGFDLEDTGTPKFASEARKAMSRARIKSFAPVVGKTGADFERTLLLTQAGQLNQARYLSELLAEADADTDRKRYLEDIHGQFDALYDRVNELLERRYYCSAEREASAGGQGLRSRAGSQTRRL